MPRVGLFITCLTDQFYPRVGVAVTKVLEKLGCEVEFPPGQTCCGQPFYNNGYEKQWRALTERMVEIFAPYEFVVTPSGSCCSMVRKNFANSLAKKTHEFSEFLTKILKVDYARFCLPERAALSYHYTCHLRGLGIGDNSARTLGRMGNVELRPLERADQCCGFGGTFAVDYPAISGAIVEDKVARIQAGGVETLVCDDAGCTMNIAGMCHRRNVDVRVKHSAELLAEAMG